MSDSEYENSSAMEWEDPDSENYGAQADDNDEDDIMSRRGAAQPYEILTRHDLIKDQQTSLETVQSFLGCPARKARLLLMHYSWDTDRLMGTIAENGSEFAFRMAGVAQDEASHPTSGEITCQICFCDVPVTDATTMDCGHTFCNDCWRGHFTVQIKENRSRRLACMADKCGIRCNEDKVRALLGGAWHQQLLQRYDGSMQESYVEDNKRVKWCPSVPHCGAAVRVRGDVHVEPTCACGFKFCFNCTLEPHSPCTCDMWKAWLQKCADDSETKNWLSAHTKPCPKCSKLVHKDGGCNLVVCACGQAFCWLCGAATGREHTWSQIQGHSCGRWKDEAEARAAQSQRQLARYLHYYKFWHGHMASQKQETEQRQAMHQKVAVLESKQTAELQDYAWLRQALDQLCETRAILGYSYVFAFYMFGGEMFRDEIDHAQNKINQNLFEDQQTQLEQEIERLSKMIETPAERMGAEMRLTIINSAKNVEVRTQHLYTLIEHDLLGQLTCSNNYIAPYKGIPSPAPTSGHVAAIMTVNRSGFPLDIPDDGAGASVPPLPEQINGHPEATDLTKEVAQVQRRVTRLAAAQAELMGAAGGAAAGGKRGSTGSQDEAAAKSRRQRR